MMEGRLIVIAGSDGSGKGTQTRLLAEHLHRLGREVVTLDFPDYESVPGKLIAAYLRGEFGKATEVDPYFAASLYAYDRFLKLAEITKALSSGATVLCNRYVESNIAHQAIKLPAGEQDAFISWVLELEHGRHRLPRPDLTIFLHVPYSFRTGMMARAERSYLEGRELDDHEKSGTHQQAAEEMYLTLAERQNWFLVPCVKEGGLLSREEVHGLIFGHLKEKGWSL